MLRDETDKQRGIAALCSVYQRLALAKTVQSRLSEGGPTFRWLPYDLLESIGLYLVPPKQENLSNGKSNPRTLKAEKTAGLQAAAWAQGARTAYVQGTYHQGLIIGGEGGGGGESAPASPVRDPTDQQEQEQEEDPTVVEEEYVTLATVPLRNLPGGVGSKQVGTMRKGVGIFVKWSIAVNGRTWVCCTQSSRSQKGGLLAALLRGSDATKEFWTQLRSADGQRNIKRADGSEDLALQGFWEGPLNLGRLTEGGGGAEDAAARGEGRGTRLRWRCSRGRCSETLIIRGEREAAGGGGCAG